MSRYDEMKGNMQALYAEALKELEELDRKRADIAKEIEFLAPLCGKKANVAVPAVSGGTFTVADLKKAEDSKKSNKRPGRKSKKAAVEAVVVEGKKERIKEEKLRGIVMDCLKNAYPNSLSASEIFEKIEKAGLPSTASFKTRVYGKLGDWTKDGVLDRPERGVYRYVKEDK